MQPHTEVKKSTIAGWIKSVMKESGIDTNFFKPHLNNITGLCTKDILLKQGNWWNKSVWQRHYKTFVVSLASFLKVLYWNKFFEDHFSSGSTTRPGHLCHCHRLQQYKAGFFSSAYFIVSQKRKMFEWNFIYCTFYFFFYEIF